MMIRRGTNRHSAYTMRIMASLAMSLLLVGLAFNLPLTFKSQPATWRLPGRHSAPALGFHDIGMDAALGIPTAPPPSAGHETAPVALDTTILDEELDDHTHAADPAPVLSKVEHMPVLEFVEEMPQVRGGLAAYYIHIEYPAEAKLRGIQGRLTLGFVVEPDGTTSNVHVMDSLHPLCDSAAVRALRQTTFIPGQHQGKAKRVRMRLPVRFVLIDPDSTGTAVSSFSPVQFATDKRQRDAWKTTH